MERGLFELAACLRVAGSFDKDTDIVAFAEEILRQRLCEDFDAMQALVEEAYGLAQEGTPPSNPFETAAPASAPAPAPVPTPPPAPTTGRERKVDLSLSDSVPDFKEVAAITDRAEAETAMRTLLQACQELKVSDLHLSADARPFARFNRQICYLSDVVLSEETSRLLNTALLTEERQAEFEARRDLDFALELGEQQRYRVNLMVHKTGIAGTYRIIPTEVPTLEALGFEDLRQIRRLLTYNNGLILVTGPVGSGKTVTLAAMIAEINRTRHDHLIAVEEPIEIVQQSINCHITQREVGLHTNKFSTALKGALRQDPDIIVIGEMRDLETIEMAISASETGHLVIGTLHTNDAANTLNRVLDVFPAAQQTQIRTMLSHALRGIICQNLVPAADGGMALAYELLISNTAVRNLIQDNKPEGLVNVMETGASEGMQLMDKSILSLWERDLITDEVALKSLRNRMKRHQLRELIKLHKPTTER